MALNDGLTRFRLQQERNQATLSTIAATKAAASSSATNSQHHPPPPTPAPAPAPAAVRFSDDIPRVDIAGNGAVAERLRDNPKVRFDGERYSYRRKHGIRGKDELLSLITSFPDGLPASEVEGVYPSVMEELQALKSSGDIYLLPVERDVIAYPNDPRSRMEVAAEVKQMFHEVKLLQDMLDIEKELRKNGEKPATDTAKRRAAEKIHGRQPEPEKARKKPRGITSRTSSPMSISRDSLTCLVRRHK